VRDLEIAAVVRALRQRNGWTQRELGRRAGVSQRAVSRLESGALDGFTLRVLRRISAPLGLAISLDGRWRGGALARLLDADHALIQNAFKVILERAGWVVVPEVTFNWYGDRGSYDLLAWHPLTGVLLVVEIKTVLADVQGLLRPLDVKLRRARDTARNMAWQPRAVVGCLVIAEGSTSRRRIQRHAALFARFALRGRSASAWLKAPAVGPAGLLLFHKLPRSHGASVRRAGRQRVRSARGQPSVKNAESAAPRASSGV